MRKKRKNGEKINNFQMKWDIKLRKNKLFNGRNLKLKWK